jgi:hypothetical protein
MGGKQMERIEKQLRLVEHDDLVYPIQVHLDETDKRILSIFEKHPAKGWRVNQILPILIDSGFQTNYALLARRLDILCTLTILEKRKIAGKVFRYYLP